ncbi:FtsZ/tubulin family protein [Natronorubrum sulfidifaciens]|uniref:Tubulin/FtsZ GTPase n=1 Tax=Natronorubrum sulfidifaciens JCM 14089 TaxID=1230460 RepID=L9WAC1_9EURY|nr:cell division protein FtsZ [Natronorubrum sulfidifaciens]ELY45263.1 Tubulin/FtsZ GTPase [Natronorubrum sulfidifaciens JCM 14089]
MQLEVLGLGGAGCRLADAIRAAAPADHAFLTDVFAFDTDESTLQGTVIPESHRAQYGQGTALEGSNGLDGDLEQGFEAGQAVVDDLLAVRERAASTAPDAILVTVGLGGTTGGPTAPALVATLQRTVDAPVYVLATLPADREFDPDAGGADRGPHSGVTATTESDEPPRPAAASHAIRTLEALDGLANAIVLFDNEAWLRPGETLADARSRSNREVATRVAAVFAGSDTDGTVAQTVIDASDIARILGTESAIVSLGYGEQAVETTSSRFGLGLLPTERAVETSEAVSAVETVVRKGVRGKLSLECAPETAARGLLVVGGPPSWLNRQAIAEGQRAFQSTIGGTGVLGGDAPRPDGETVFAAVVLAGVESDRLERLRAAAD